MIRNSSVTGTVINTFFTDMQDYVLDNGTCQVARDFPNLRVEEDKVVFEKFGQLVVRQVPGDSASHSDAAMILKMYAEAAARQLAFLQRFDLILGPLWTFNCL